MNEVFAVPTRPPVQAPEPGDDGPLEELQDQLVPVQEDELPQGVLNLVAALILHQRPLLETARTLAWQAMRVGHEALAGERDEALSVGRDAVAVEPGKMTQRSSPQHLEPLVSRVDKTMASVSIERLSFDPLAVPRAPSTPRLDEQPLLQAPLSFQGMRQAPTVAPAAIPSPAPAPPMLEVMVEALPGTDRGVLQVPFNKGAASGQITITRGPEEPTRNLTLNPSNTSVFEQLKAPFELAREPAWRLTDSGGEQSRQGSHQAPDEDQDEPAERPA